MTKSKERGEREGQGEEQQRWGEGKGLAGQKTKKKLPEKQGKKKKRNRKGERDGDCHGPWPKLGSVSSYKRDGIWKLSHREEKNSHEERRY